MAANKSERGVFRAAREHELLSRVVGLSAVTGPTKFDHGRQRATAESSEVAFGSNLLEVELPLD